MHQATAFIGHNLALTSPIHSEAYLLSPADPAPPSSSQRGRSGRPAIIIARRRPCPFYWAISRYFISLMSAEAEAHASGSPLFFVPVSYSLNEVMKLCVRA